MNIFIGNLNYRMEASDLESLFSEFGEVTSAKIIKDRFTGRSKGFGFVEMSNDEDATKAIDSLNGQEAQGRPLRVSKALPPKPRDNYNRDSE